MGRPKAWLEVCGEPLLVRTVRTVSAVCDPVVVGAGPGQDLPPLPSGVRVETDGQRHGGPLVGLHTGLRVLLAGAPGAFVTATDIPRLTSDIVRSLVSLADPDRIVCVETDRWKQPLCAVYPAAVRPVLERLVSAGERRVMALLESFPCRPVRPADLGARPADFESVNTPEAWERVRSDLEG